MNTVGQDVAAVARVAVVPAIMEVVSQTTGMRFVAVARVTDTSWTCCAVRDEIGFGLQPGGELELCTTICDEIRQHRQPVLFSSASADPKYRDHATPRQYGFESYLSIPIVRADGSFFGTLCALDPKPAQLDSPLTRKTFELFAQLIASHLDAQELDDQRLHALAVAADTSRQLELENDRIVRLLDERDQTEVLIKRELKDTRRLRDVAAALLGPDGNFDALYKEILDAAIEMSDADAGTIQLLEPASQTLNMLASRGIERGMLDHFACVDASSGSPCGVALATRKRSFVEFDAPDAPDIDGSNRMHLAAGLRCAQSTPLMSRSGRALGMFSTHWKHRRELNEREVRFLDLLARQAADLIERNQVQAALLESERELREEARRKDEFLAVLAHELRNPLAPIRSGVEVLKRAAHDPALVERVRPMMERQVAHVVRLVDDLLDVSRLKSGKVHLKREPVALGDLVNRALEAHRAQAAAAGIDLSSELHDGHLELVVDPTRLSQVISNVLHNAVKFTPAAGTIALRSAVEPGPEGDTLVLRVADSGMGIAPEVLPTIFNLFTQARTDRHGGMGIGLALSRQLMELHGGSIEARSGGIGFGSEFIIRLPMGPKTAQRQAPSAEQPLDGMAGSRVLVVDDNQDAADSIAMLLAGAEAAVRVAYDAAAIVEVAKEFDPHLVLLDIGLPGVDGYEACRRLREQLGQSVQIVALTGWGQEEDRRRASEAGFDTHLTKPVDFAHLARVARQALQRPVA
ncbi:GAF domain-containing protein [Roseateles sp. YR242]|uniref:hybrid sensor histidine kinase/response regulator n=1 Tax=Roseateles sp. YR242 TaxID=1855305 RepID=UPI0015A4FCC0|nr:GAF domain-containing protein [Roseateles sp. YR242]